MRIKICGLFRDEDIDYVNEARPDYAGFVFAPSKRQVSTAMAQYLRFRLANGITPVGVFVNAPISEIVSLYQNGTISVAQLHGSEDASYTAHLKKMCSSDCKQPPFKIIKVIQSKDLTPYSSLLTSHFPADYFLIDSGSGTAGSSAGGTGKPFNWQKLKLIKFKKPWFIAGGIDIKNIGKAMAFNPFAVDISSGAETKGVKDRKKILELVSVIRKGNTK